MDAEPDAETLIEALDEPALIIEMGRVQAANTAALDLFGRSIGQRDVRLAIRHPEALEHILAERAADVSITGIGGAERPWILSVRPFGRQLLVRLIDQSAAIAAERMRVDFVANASHELRTPLSKIVGYAETLAEAAATDPEDVHRFAAIIESEARRMVSIVEDLLSLSRIEAHRFVSPQDRVDVEELMREAIAGVERRADEQGITIDLRVEKGLPALIGDPPQLIQMVDNLIANAMRYGCTDSERSVVVAVRRANQSIMISVCDRGPGIARQHIPRLTERFYRVDPARSRESGGTGLGLAIVKHIVERHRGRLEFRSEPGQGTEVLVQLPTVSR